ncbi:MAG TPA: hypothetical protein VGR68_10615 [Actinomycetota bacterium]|jgi:hypothetical protein|nr:hypothetical protein [Actinomycetota bacterium]
MARTEALTGPNGETAYVCPRCERSGRGLHPYAIPPCDPIGRGELLYAEPGEDDRGDVGPAPA